MLLKMTPYSIEINQSISLGGEKLVVFAGPCSIESKDTTMRVAEALKLISMELPIGVVFKSSFDKANRTSIQAYRSAGLERGLEILGNVKREFGLPVITDIHEPAQASEVAEVVDVLQIPAFLSRQTDLLLAAARTGLPVNVKKGQFMSPYSMRYAVEKVESISPKKAFLTERGTFFGYGDLVVDFRSLPVMREVAPVVYDVTHSVQKPGTLGSSSGGEAWLGPHLARAAVAIGVDGLFIETHPEPENALSDGPNMVKLRDLSTLLKQLLDIRGDENLQVRN